VRPAALVAAVALAVSAAWLAAIAAALDWQLVFSLDDAYIHLQYARELAEGRVFSYDGGDPRTTGATSTLWPVLLAPGFLGGSVEVGVVWSAVVCVALVGATGAALVWASLPLGGPRLAALAAHSVVLSGWFLATALSGMESALIAFGVALLLGALVRGREGLLVVALLVVALTRPEGAIAAGAIALVLLAGALRAGRRRSALRLALPLAAVAAQAAAWTAVSGRPTTDTAISKSVLYDPTLPHGLQASAWLSAFGRATAQFVTGRVAETSHPPDGAWLVLPVAAAAVALAGGVLLWQAGRRDVVLAAGAVAGAYLAVSTSADWSAHGFRYLTALLPVLAVLGVAALSRLDARPAALPVGTALAAGAVAFSALGAPLWHARALSWSEHLAGQHVFLGRWLGENLPPGSRIAFHDAGALKLYSGLPHFDWLGLVTPDEAVAYRSGWGAIYERLERLPADARPDWFVMWSSVTGDLVDSPFVADAVFTSPDLGPQAMTGGPTMTVYRTDWSSLPRATAPPPGGAVVWELDVADLEGEHAAGYDWRGPDPHRRPATALVTAAPAEGAEPIAEGCREVVSQRVEVPTGGTLVVRVHGAAVLTASVDGVPGGTASSAGEGFSLLSLPLRAGGAVELASAGEPYTTCHLWLLA
jgi:hypothetical protein